VLKNPSIRINARSAEAEFNVVPISDPDTSSYIIEKFRAKYGVNDVKKYYSKLDVASTLPFSSRRADPASSSLFDRTVSTRECFDREYTEALDALSCHVQCDETS
jgi:hypothetical protein